MDFIRLFLDAEALDTIVDEDNSADTKLNMHSIRVKKRLSTGEIVGQLVLFLIAGYETTSNALAYIVYHLAINTHVQHKLAAEIDSVTDGCDQPLTYEMLGRMKYTDALIKETLRLYPLASPVQARLCMADTIVGSSHRVAIPAGLTVTADVWSVQHSSEIWGDNAEEFDPDR
jgi:cytochrome P450